MSVWHWIRHGPTHQTAFTGWRDVDADLSNTDQLSRLDAYLPQDAVLISSDLRRSISTAGAISGARKRLPHDPNLREFHFGSWDGVHFSDVAEQFPDLSRSYWENPGDFAPPGGESWNDAMLRVSNSVARLETLFPNRDKVVVAHFGVILTQVQVAQGTTAQHVLRHKIDPLSVTSVNYAEGRVLTINHIP